MLWACDKNLFTVQNFHGCNLPLCYKETCTSQFCAFMEAWNCFQNDNKSILLWENSLFNLLALNLPRKKRSHNNYWLCNKILINHIRFNHHYYTDINASTILSKNVPSTWLNFKSSYRIPRCDFEDKCWKVWGGDDGQNNYLTYTK